MSGNQDSRRSTPAPAGDSGSDVRGGASGAKGSTAPRTKSTAIERPPSGAADAPPLFVDQPFPPYRFVPGVTPHPFAHAEGWGFGKERPPPPLLAPERWAENTPYLRGCDFFNRGWWWEAHEAWEDLWHVVEGHHPRQWQLLKGLIQLAACALQRERGIDGGAERLLLTALACLERVASGELPDFVDNDPASAGEGSPAGAIPSVETPPSANSPPPQTAYYCGLDLTALADEARARLSQPCPRVDGFYLRPAPLGAGSTNARSTPEDS